MAGLELASRVSVDQAYDYAEGSGYRIAVYDFGVKLNILRSFSEHDCSIRVFPASTPLDEVLAWRPEGVFSFERSGRSPRNARCHFHGLRVDEKRYPPVWYMPRTSTAGADPEPGRIQKCASDTEAPTNPFETKRRDESKLQPRITDLQSGGTNQIATLPPSRM